MTLAAQCPLPLPDAAPIKIGRCHSETVIAHRVKRNSGAQYGVEHGAATRGELARL